jgi:hypothetical protein
VLAVVQGASRLSLAEPVGVKWWVSEDSNLPAPTPRFNRHPLYRRARERRPIISVIMMRRKNAHYPDSSATGTKHPFGLIIQKWRTVQESNLLHLAVLRFSKPLPYHSANRPEYWFLIATPQTAPGVAPGVADAAGVEPARPCGTHGFQDRPPRQWGLRIQSAKHHPDRHAALQIIDMTRQLQHSERSGTACLGCHWRTERCPRVSQRPAKTARSSR